MLLTQTQHSHPAQNLVPWRKPLISSLLRPKQSFLRKNVCLRYVNNNHSTTIKAISSSSSSSSSSKQTTITSVKAVLAVKVTVCVLESILLELVSADLDPETGFEKETIKGYTRRMSQDKNEVKYEWNFEVAEEFGEIGAVLVENEHHNEMYLKNIAFDGFPNGPVCVTCNSWVASKFDNPEKRIFFTNKPYLSGQTPSGLKRLRQKGLENLRGDGRGECKTHDRIYGYDIYNDSDSDSTLELKRPIPGGKEHLYPRRYRTSRSQCKTCTNDVAIN